MNPPWPSDLPIVDHHAHLSAGGDGIAAVRRFAAAGGTHLFLASQSYGAGPPLRVSEYREQFDETERLARTATAATGVVIYPVLAPFPVDLRHQAEKLGAGPAAELQSSALDEAGRRVVQHRAVAIGEVGRFHFPVEEALVRAAALTLEHALGVARDAGCPALVHSEDLTAEGFRGLAALAASAGLPAHRVIKHYARSVVPTGETGGAVPSYLARREVVAGALGQPGPWFLETDYLDDPRRPGAVLDLATVPRRAAAVAAQGPEAIERLRIPFVESVRKVYGLEPVAPASGTSP